MKLKLVMGHAAFHPQPEVPYWASLIRPTKLLKSKVVKKRKKK